MIKHCQRDSVEEESGQVLNGSRFCDISSLWWVVFCCPLEQITFSMIDELGKLLSSISHVFFFLPKDLHLTFAIS